MRQDAVLAAIRSVLEQDEGILERDPLVRIDFETAAVRRFEDTRDQRRIQHDLLREAARRPASGGMFETLREALKERVPELVAVYAFGSRSRGDATEASDYDLALLAARPLDPHRRWELQEELAVLARAPVDLVDLRRASSVMRVQVLKDARVLLDNDRSARELFEATALSDYARLNEERRGILEDVRDRGSVHG